MKLSNNKILITGGATGIGLGLTERFLLEPNTVIETLWAEHAPHGYLL